MRSSVRAAFACAALAAGAASPSGLSAQALSGRVVDGATGRPIAGVPVRLLRAAPHDTSAPPDTTPLATSATAADGVFLLSAPAPGTYRARIGEAFFTPAATFASVDSVDVREYRLATPASSGCGRFSSGSRRDPVVRAAATLDSVARMGGALCEFQVEKQAASVPGTLHPAFPTGIVVRNHTESVVVQFVVRASGRADLATFRVLEASNPDYVPAVRNALLAARFYPAEIGGRKVAQLVQLPVTFTLSGPLPGPLPGPEKVMTVERPLFGPPFKPLPPTTGFP